MYYETGNSNREQAQEDQDNQYPQASVRQYLNMKRTSKNKCCMCLFWLYMAIAVMIMGIGFFYGNYTTLSKVVNGAAQTPAECPMYVSEDYTTCVNTCSGTLYLQVVCAADGTYNPSQSSQLQSLISMYDIQESLATITYITFGLLVLTGTMFLLIIWFPKIVYVYVTCLFFMLLGFAFYLLKSAQLRQAEKSIDKQSIFYTNEESITQISYLLMGMYLLVFPLVLFSPKKIRIAVTVLKGLKQFYQKMKTIGLFTGLVLLLTWGAMLVEIFLVVNIYTDGDRVTSKDSFLYLYEDVYLVHPAVLTLHFIGAYWFFTTLISCHKYFMGSALCFWYFQESQGLKPVARGLKRTWFHLGTAAMDGILMPVEWLTLIIYSILKTQKDVDPQKQIESEQPMCCMSCLHGLRAWLTSFYLHCNRGSPTSAVLTNHPYFQACQMSASVLSSNNYVFFNIGGTLTIFLSLFWCLMWIIISYAVIYGTIYNESYPPPISSMLIPMLCVFFTAWVTGSIMTNLFSAPLDALLFCYVLEKQKKFEISHNQIKGVLEKEFYQEDKEEQCLVVMDHEE